MKRILAIILICTFVFSQSKSNAEKIEKRIEYAEKYEGEGFTIQDADIFTRVMGDRMEILMIFLKSNNPDKIARWNYYLLNDISRYQVPLDLSKYDEHTKKQMIKYKTTSQRTDIKWSDLGFKQIVFIHEMSKIQIAKPLIEIDGTKYEMFTVIK